MPTLHPGNQEERLEEKRIKDLHSHGLHTHSLNLLGNGLGGILRARVVDNNVGAPAQTPKPSFRISRAHTHQCCFNPQDRFTRVFHDALSTRTRLWRNMQMFKFYPPLATEAAEPAFGSPLDMHVCRWHKRCAAIVLTVCPVQIKLQNRCSDVRFSHACGMHTILRHPRIFREGSSTSCPARARWPCRCRGCTKHEIMSVSASNETACAP